jgi:hypothetical protein
MKWISEENKTIKKMPARRNVNGMSHEKKKRWVLEMEVSSCYKIEYIKYQGSTFTVSI